MHPVHSSGLLRLVSLCAVPALLVLSGCRETRQTQTQPPEAVWEHPAVMDIPVTGSWVGHLDGVNNATILPQVTGYLQTQAYTNGAAVKKGEILFRLDDATFKDREAQAQAALQQARAHLQQLQYDLNVYKPLAAEDAISKQKYEDTRLAVLVAQAQTAQAEAALALAKQNLAYTVLYAPFDGIAGISRANIGDLVGPQSGPLATVSSVDPIRVNIAVTQQEWIRQAGKGGDEGIQPGSRLSIILKDGHAYPHQATVTAIDRAFNLQTGTIRVQANLPNTDNLLRPGMFIRATTTLSTVKNALTVPVQAVLSTQGRFFIITLDEQDHPSVIPVEAGPQAGERRQVIPLLPESLTPQSRVVVKGLLQAEEASMTPGSRMIPVPTTSN